MRYIGITRQLRIIAEACANIDASYGPYPNIQEALTTIPKAIRKEGLTVGILENGTVTEYWFNSGIDDNNLIIKTGGSGNLSAIIAELADKVDKEPNKFLMTQAERDFIQALIEGGGGGGGSMSMMQDWTIPTGTENYYLPAQLAVPFYNDTRSRLSTLEAGEGGQVIVDWEAITGKPDTFNSSAHTHAIGDVAGLQDALNFQQLWKVDEEGNIYTEYNAYSLKNISAFGLGEEEDGGVIINVIDNLTSTSKTDPLSANQGRYLKTLIDNIEVGEGGQVLVDWEAITGKPDTFVPSAHTHTFESLTSIPTTLSGYGITDAYTKAQVDSSLDLKLNKLTFDDLFEKVETSAGKWAVKVKYNLFSVGEISAFGAGDSEGGSGGGSISMMQGWAFTTETENYYLPAKLAVPFYNDINTRVTAIDGRVTDLENSAGSGSVTEVGISVPTGLSVSNSPITSSGIIAIGLQTGYSIPTTAKQGQWDTAFTNNHTHDNKGVIDLITQDDLNVLSLLSIVDGNLRINANTYSTGNLSAFGLGEEGGGSGGGSMSMMQAWSTSVETENYYLPAKLAVPFYNDTRDRLTVLEAGTAPLAHVHTIADVTGLQTALADKLETTVFNAHNTDNIRHITGAERTKWNTAYGWGNHTNKYSHIAHSGYSNSIRTADARNVEDTPTSRNAGLYVDFKTSADANLAGSTYVGVLTFRPFGVSTDISGGGIMQIGSNNNSLYYRRFLNADTWRDWVSIWHSGDFTQAEITNWREVRTWWQNVGQYLKRDATNQALYTDENFYSTKEVSAYGIGLGGGSGGGDFSMMQDWTPITATENYYLPAKLAVPFYNDTRSRLSTLEAGTAPASHNHPISDITNLQTTLADKLETSVFNSHKDNSNTEKHVTQDDLNVLSLFSIVDGNLRIDANTYSTGNLSAFGLGEEGGVGGGSMSMMQGWTFTTATENYYLPAKLAVPFYDDTRSRLSTLEGGSATTVNVSGAGDLLASVSKVGNNINFIKGNQSWNNLVGKPSTFAPSAHTHTISDITNLQTTLNNKLETSVFNTHNNDNVRHITGAERTKWNDVVTDFGNLEIGGRNLLLNSNTWVGKELISARGVTFESLVVEGDSVVLVSYDGVTGDPYFRLDNIIYELGLQTYSVEAKLVSGNGSLLLNINDRGAKYHILTEEWERYYCTVDNDKIGGVYNFVNMYPVLGTGAYSFYIRLPMLTKGNKSYADWTPAPEDQVSDWNTTDVNSFSFIKNKPTTLSGYGITDAVTLNTSQTISGAKTFSSLLTASAGTNTPKVSFGNGWTAEGVGVELQFKLNGVIQAKIVNGALVSMGEVTAFY